MARPNNSSPQTLKVLSAMLSEPKAWRHGYDLSKETGLKSGTLYPLLIRLSDQGLLEAEWREPVSEGLPARHAYRLTMDGIALARARLTPRSGRRSAQGGLNWAQNRPLRAR